MVRLDPPAIAATWPRIEKLVTAAAERSHGRYTAALVKSYAEQGKWQLWIAVDGAGEIIATAGTRFITYDTGLKSIFVIFGTGRLRHLWQHFMADLLVFGKAHGCTIAEGSLRRGWRRILPGWTHTHDFCERAL